MQLLNNTTKGINRLLGVNLTKPKTWEKCMSGMSEIAVKEKEAKKKKDQRQEMERTIEEAKWNMHAEKWDLAEKQLVRARDTAVSLRDKSKIDEILGLLKKCKEHQKVEL